MLLLSLCADVWSATRHLRRAPAFCFAAIALLATGIGAVTTVYSVVDCLVLRPLPYPQADRLIGFRAHNHAKAITQSTLSVTDFRDFRERQHALSVVGAQRGDLVTWLRDGKTPVQLASSYVTEDFFKVFALTPELGRVFREDEFSIGSARTAVLSHRAWVNRFAADAQVVGKIVTLNSEPTTIIGVMPDSLHEPAFVEIWRPFPPEIGENIARDSRYWTVVGRLAASATLAQAQAEATTISANLAAEFPEVNRNWSFAAQPLKELRVGGIKGALWLLLGATALLLSVACFNLANLLLSRGLSRRAEMAIRLSLGSSNRRLLGQVLLENMLVALPGGIVGVGLAGLALRVFVNTIPPDYLPGSSEVAVDGRILLVATAVSMLAGLGAGLLPAVQACRSNINGLVKENSARSGLSRNIRHAQQALLVAQVALTFVVLTSAALLWRSLSTLNAVRPGFDYANLFTMGIMPPMTQDSASIESARYFERLTEAAADVPGIEAAAVDASAPLAGFAFRFPYSLVGQTQDGNETDQSIYHFISPGFFETTKARIVAGRGMNPHDDENGERVVWVNQALARIIAPNGNALGKKLNLVSWLAPSPHFIVGIVGDTLQENLTDPAPPQLFVPQRQATWFFTTLIVRAKPGVPLPARALTDALQHIDPSLAVNFKPLREAIARTTVQPRLMSLVFAGLAVITFGFTLLGVYACVNFSVAQRSAEFGLRMALGATPLGIVRQMSRELGGTILLALLIGLLASLVFGNVLHRQLYGIGSHDPAALAVMGAALLIASFVAAVVPLVRAAFVAPSIALSRT